MSLTDNAIRIYLGTSLGQKAKEVEFSEFEVLWEKEKKKMKKKKDKKTLKALDEVICKEFYLDAIFHS